MQIDWSKPAQRDLQRLYAFLAESDSLMARRIIDAIIDAAEQLATFPQLGTRLDRYSAREIRRFIVGDYEVRYELGASVVRVLNVWHEREDR
ncbi:MAG: type II toxin-antitoxin system RelE/ParE family toxin [Rickettsiales bacterium]